MSASAVYLCVAIVLVYLVAQDANVYSWVVLRVRLVNLIGKRLVYAVRFNPSTPWVRFSLWRNSHRLARELRRELDQ